MSSNVYSFWFKFQILMSNIGIPISQLEYVKVIGCLVYTMTVMTPDVVCAKVM